MVYGSRSLHEINLECDIKYYRARNEIHTLKSCMIIMLKKLYLNRVGIRWRANGYYNSSYYHLILLRFAVRMVPYLTRVPLAVRWLAGIYYSKTGLAWVILNRDENAGHQIHSPPFPTYLFVCLPVVQTADSLWKHRFLLMTVLHDSMPFLLGHFCHD